MALTRRLLKSMGIEDEKIDQIIEAHTETVDALKEDRDKYKDDSAKLTKVQKELDEIKAQQEENGGNSSDSAYKVKYEAIKEEFNSYKKEVETQKTKSQKEKAFREILKECGVSEKRIDSVVKVSGEAIDKMELDENGVVKGKDEISKAVTEEWSDFIVKTSTQGAATANPPASTGTSAMTKEQIMAISDRGERRKAIAANIKLFDGSQQKGS